MKILRTVLLSLLVAASAMGQGNSQQPPATKPPAQQQITAPGTEPSSAGQAKIDAAKEADIMRLLEVTGAKANMLQVMATMQNNIRPMMTKSMPPGDYREQLINLFLDEFQSRMKSQVQDLMNSAVLAYDKYFTDEDIKGLIRFYETPLGQKATAELPKLMTEMQSQGMKLGEKIGRDSMTEVLSTHPELAKELQDAAKASRPQSPGAQ